MEVNSGGDAGDDGETGETGDRGAEWRGDASSTTNITMVILLL